MAYINFKEEKSKGKIQIEKRKNNNEKLYQSIIKHKENGQIFNLSVFVI